MRPFGVSFLDSITTLVTVIFLLTLTSCYVLIFSHKLLRRKCQVPYSAILVTKTRSKMIDFHSVKLTLTRMLAINVSIPNLKIARLVQF